jgi:hypothetical protein
MPAESQRRIPLRPPAYVAFSKLRFPTLALAKQGIGALLANRNKLRMHVSWSPVQNGGRIRKYSRDLPKEPPWHLRLLLSTRPLKSIEVLVPGTACMLSHVQCTESLDMSVKSFRPLAGAPHFLQIICSIVFEVQIECIQDIHDLCTYIVLVAVLSRVLCDAEGHNALAATCALQIRSATENLP